MRRMIAAALAAAVSALAQTTICVRGVVLEWGTEQPVPGAEVTISARVDDSGRAPEGWERGEHRPVATDANGGFTASFDAPGRYVFSARKDGYVTVAGNEVAELELTSEKPEEEVRLRLARPGELKGRVIDEESGGGAHGVKLRAIRITADGFRLFDSMVEVSTDVTGEFRATRLSPGDYLVQVRPAAVASERVRTEFGRDEIDEIDRGFGGQDYGAATHVGPGEVVTLGRIVARRMELYRVHARLRGIECGEGARLDARLTAEDEPGLDLGAPARAREWLITGFRRGSYRLKIRMRGEERVAHVPFTVIDKGITVDAVFGPPLTVDGVVTGAKGALEAGHNDLTILLRSADSAGVSFVKPPLDAEESVPFRITGLHATEHALVVLGLAQRRYVKEVRHNNIAIEGDRLGLDVPAAAHRLEIAIGDDPGEISGTVRSPAIVYARRSPRGLARWVSTGSDGGGRFHLTGLAPGEYRVVAIRGREGIEPQAIERALAAGTRVDVESNGRATVALDAVEAR